MVPKSYGRFHQQNKQILTRSVSAPQVQKTTEGSQLYHIFALDKEQYLCFTRDEILDKGEILM